MGNIMYIETIDVIRTENGAFLATINLSDGNEFQTETDTLGDMVQEINERMFDLYAESLGLPSLEIFQ